MLDSRLRGNDKTERGRTPSAPTKPDSGFRGNDAISPKNREKSEKRVQRMKRMMMAAVVVLAAGMGTARGAEAEAFIGKWLNIDSRTAGI